MDLKYPRNRLGNHISNLGTPRSQEIFNIWNFPNRQIPWKLNSRGIGNINYLIFMSRFSVLSVPRLSSLVFCPVSVHYRVIIRTYSRIKVRHSTILAFLTCHTLTLFTWLRNATSQRNIGCTHFPPPPPPPLKKPSRSSYARWKDDQAIGVMLAHIVVQEYMHK